MIAVDEILQKNSAKHYGARCYYHTSPVTESVAVLTDQRILNRVKNAQHQKRCADCRKRQK